ncbi:uncharacterized protein LOC107408041 isoform X2 [Ziziphus jujuba]|uniref:Uncharacterized protein LOC107408041 isoform X2 n=1 Tax=Ziziphus jujuba TaxID=326968 RepID=A0A6P3Z2I9_ZIZJJ|nr:uncharacterized protein LOC107408041 isoform X2 [Ziziphus jujuba]
MDNITASELAGFGVGTLLLCATIAAPKIDSFIAASQRSSLGMCKKCGNLRMIACSRCKGVGFIREGIPFGLTFVDDLYQSFGPGNLKARSIACSTCQGKGHFCCPYCS